VGSENPSSLYDVEIHYQLFASLLIASDWA